jgi:SAM-dependent methyltransferase
MFDETPVRKAVRDHYSQLAQDKKGHGSCCGPSSLASNVVPQEASQIYDGCGLPVEVADIGEGDVVVDLGSGGGYDVFRTSKLVGQSGRVIGVDATPEMIWRARETAKKYAFSNVEFRLGEIEHMPLDPDSVDVVISNCVINLAPDKGAVFREAFRVLKLGGRLAVSDTVSECTLKVDSQDLNAWAECSAGALPEDEYLSLMEKAGFVDIDVKGKTQSCGSQGISSITVTATKPRKA